MAPHGPGGNHPKDGQINPQEIPGRSCTNASAGSNVVVTTGTSLEGARELPADRRPPCERQAPPGSLPDDLPGVFARSHSGAT